MSQDGMTILHADHGVPTWAIFLAVKAAREISSNGVVVTTIDVAKYGPVEGLVSAIYGPIAGDEPVNRSRVTPLRRGNRSGATPILVGAKPRPTSLVTIVVNLDDDEIYTVYGGPCAPREPWDPSLSEKEREESETFWSQHALALEEGVEYA